jgi:hypothetical protein
LTADIAGRWPAVVKKRSEPCSLNSIARSAEASTTEEILDRVTGVLSASLGTSFAKQLSHHGVSRRRSVG